MGVRGGERGKEALFPGGGRKGRKRGRRGREEPFSLPSYGSKRLHHTEPRGEEGINPCAEQVQCGAAPESG